jgi:hypothetical protein
MTRFRPTASDSRPKTRKNGVPSASAAATHMYAVVSGTLSTVCMKNRA